MVSGYRRIDLRTLGSPTQTLTTVLPPPQNCCLDSTHPICRLGAKFLQGSISRFEVISIQMTLNILCKIPDISLLVSPQMSFRPTRQSPVLVLAPSQPSSTALLYTVQRLRRGEPTP